MKEVFSKRQDAEGLWEVFDPGSGDVVLLDGHPLSGLDDEQADEAIDLLRAGILSPDLQASS
jgi:hypothetical protein